MATLAYNGHVPIQVLCSGLCLDIHTTQITLLAKILLGHLLVCYHGCFTPTGWALREFFMYKVQ